MRRETFILIAMPVLFGLGFTLGKLSDTLSRFPIPINRVQRTQSLSCLKLMLTVLLVPLGLSIKKAPPRMR